MQTDTLPNPKPNSRGLWPALLAALLAIGLLLAFGHVVQEGVQQGQSRREAEARIADSRWRCYRPADRRARDDCSEPSVLPLWVNSRSHSFFTTP